MQGFIQVILFINRTNVFLRNLDFCMWGLMLDLLGLRLGLLLGGMELPRLYLLGVEGWDFGVFGFGSKLEWGYVSNKYITL